ncbi:hypothetical protein D1007_33719 [Hordeum vulgare]|nr:hypothetical protein D1007_33719 [Hordeum vulgare]
MVIPMDPPSTRQGPIGPMSRARGCAIETKVTSLLSESSFDTLGTWMLSQVEMLFMLRYHQNNLEGAMCEGQTIMNMSARMDVEGYQGKRTRPSRLRTSSPHPENPALGDTTCANADPEQLYALDIRHRPGHPASSAGHTSFSQTSGPEMREMRLCDLAEHTLPAKCPTHPAPT